MKSRVGYVYFASFAPNLLKIGFSRDPVKRMAGIRSITVKPETLTDEPGLLIGMLHGTPFTETQMMARFAPWHIIGEWFCDTDDSRKVLLFAGAYQCEAAYSILCGNRRKE